MSRREIVLAAGIVVTAVGVMLLPVGFGVSPKRDLSAFANLADTGAFVWIGLLLVVGGLLIAASPKLFRED